MLCAREAAPRIIISLLAAWSRDRADPGAGQGAASDPPPIRPAHPKADPNQAAQRAFCLHTFGVQVTVQLALDTPLCLTHPNIFAQFSGSKVL